MNALAVMSMVATTGNRFCVHHATHAGMQGDWKSRLLEAIDKSGRSGRDLSRKVKMGPNTISELRLTDKVPSFDKVLRLIDELGASQAYIILGYEIGPKEEALLKALAGLEPEALDGALALIRARVAASQSGSGPAPQEAEAETIEKSR